MATQVISIAPDGSIHGLRPKKGKGIDLRQFGRADTQRVTTIEFDPETQRYYIEWTQHGEKVSGFSGKWDGNLFKHARVDPTQWPVFLNENDPNAERWSSPLYFDEYEDANAAEVEVFTALQKAGELLG